MSLKTSLVFLIIVLGLVLFASPAEAIAPPAPQRPPEAPKLPQVVLHPSLVRVCTCESGQGTGRPQQYNIHTGKVLQGVQNPKDIGMCQINEYWNGAEARSHGWDIYTKEGNIKMANFLYKTQGLAPWGWSKHCWK